MAKKIKIPSIIYSLTIIFILLGLFGIVATRYYGNNLSDTWKDIFLDISNAVLILGIVSLIFEIREIKGYFEKILSNIISGSGFIKHLKKESLSSMHKAITNSLYGIGEDSEEGGLYNLITKKVYPYLNKPYRWGFNEHNTMEVIVSEFYKVKCITNFEVHSLSYEGQIYPFVARHAIKKFKGIVENVFILEEFLVDGAKQELKVEWEGKEDVFIFSFSKEFQMNKPLKFKYTTTYYVPIYDKEYYLIMSSPTKHFHMELIYPNAIKFHSRVFGIIAPSEDSMVRHDYGITVDYHDWMLPGHGIVIFWDDTQ